MEIGTQNELNKSMPESKKIKMFFDGAGCRPNGEGSGYAWICLESNERFVRRVPGLTNNQAEYKGFYAVLEHVPVDSQVDAYSDSQLLCFQFYGNYRVKDEGLQKCLAEIHSLISSKRLKVTLTWVPRARNLAGKLL